MQTPEWVKDAVFYQIFPDRFASGHGVPKPANLEPWDEPPTLHGFKGGDLLGVRERLDYLETLGVTAIYLNPIFASTANHRYHTHDYHKVDPILGGDEALRSLLDEAHRRSMRVILDGVFNHASRGFFQFNHTLENGKHSPYLDWFHFNKEWLASGQPLAPYHPLERVIHPPSADQGLTKFGYRAWWNLPALPKFNTDNPEVREFLWNVAERWIDFGIDGWRLDVPNEIDDDTFWREFRRRVKARNPEAYIVGEIWGEANRWLQGDQFDGVTNYPMGMAILGFVGAESLDRQVLDTCGYSKVRPLDGPAFAALLKDLVERYPAFVRHTQLNMLGGHDNPRIITCVSGNARAIRLAMALLFAVPGAPCVYYGDEVGLPGGHDPDCRRGFNWDESSWDLEILKTVKSLAEARRLSIALRRGDVDILAAEGRRVAFARRGEGASAYCVVNAGQDTWEIALPDVPQRGFRIGERVEAFSPSSGAIEAPAETAVILY